MRAVTVANSTPKDWTFQKAVTVLAILSSLIPMSAANVMNILSVQMFSVDVFLTL